jgi:hypothetical protein
MVQTISRMYATPMQAKRAFEELKQEGYQDLHIFHGPAASEEGAEPSGPSRNDTVAALNKAFILKHHASAYAERISKGASLVAVHAVFGTAFKAKTILETHEPIDSGVPETVDYANLWNEAYPVSSALQLPLLTSTKLPFEKMWNVPSLTSDKVLFSNWLGFPLLSRSRTPFSDAASLPLLSEGETPFSSSLGLPLLTKG